MFAEGFILITGAILTPSPVIRSQPSNVQTACPERSEGFKRLQLPTFNLSAAAQPSTAPNRSSKKIIRITKNEYLPSRPVPRLRSPVGSQPLVHRHSAFNLHPAIFHLPIFQPSAFNVSSNLRLAIRHSQFLIRHS
jgi:hypothetical protein